MRVRDLGMTEAMVRTFIFEAKPERSQDREGWTHARRPDLNPVVIHGGSSAVQHQLQ
jgi:hypothetical protein